LYEAGVSRGWDGPLVRPAARGRRHRNLPTIRAKPSFRTVDATVSHESAAGGRVVARAGLGMPGRASAASRTLTS